MKKTVVAFDFGASSGRAIAGTYQDGRLEYKEVHRFDNIPVDDNGRMCHNFPAICKEVDAALSKINSADGLSFDTWGVDYGLLNKSGNLLRLPCHYRDTRHRRNGRESAKKNTGRQSVPGHRQSDYGDQHPVPVDHGRHCRCREAAVYAGLICPPPVRQYANGTHHCFHLSAAGSGQPNLAGQILPRPAALTRSCWPAVGPSATVLGKTDGGIQVIATAGHDTQCAVAAMPAAAGEQPAFLSCGTWSLIGCELDEPILTPESRADDLSNEQGANGKTNYLKNISGLWLIQETRRAYRRAGAEYSYNDLEQLARAAEPFTCFIDPDDPRFSTPGDLPERIRDFCRETGQPVPESVGAVVRCIYESLAMKYRFALDQISARTGRQFNVLHLLGGGTKDGFLCQMTADSLAFPVIAGPTEATALGNMLLQLICTEPAAGCGSRSGADPQDRDLKNL